jgi:hypothetical protein
MSTFYPSSKPWWGAVKECLMGGHKWFMPVILATQEAEIKRIAVQSQPGRIVRSYLENTLHKKGLVEWLKVGPEFKPQYLKKKKKKTNNVYYMCIYIYVC